MAVTDAAELQEAAVRTALDALGLGDADEAAKQLAIRYARSIDDATATGDPKIEAWAVRWIGPLLLDVLEAIGATPRARGKRQDDNDAPDGLADMMNSWSA